MDPSYLDFDFPQPIPAPSTGRNFLRTSLAWLTQTLHDNASEDVIYVQTNGNRIACRAMFGNKLLHLDDQAGGFRIELTDMDFLIAASDLTNGGSVLEPLRGDLIVCTIGINVEIFEVAPYSGEETIWRWADPHESMMRIRTKHVETDAYVPAAP